jgi:hypothetical protein
LFCCSLIFKALNSAFDEKTLFPKYILDYEARMRQEHKKILENATGVDKK